MRKKRQSKNLRKTYTPRIYFDTSVIRDCMKLRNMDSIYLLKLATQKRWSLVTSIFSIMELLDTEKDDRFFIKKLGEKQEINEIVRGKYQKDLSDMDFEQIFNQMRNFFILYKFDFRTLNDIGWDNALSISLQTNLSATDSIQLALGVAFDVIVTTDNFLIKIGKDFIKKNKIKTRICQPSEVLKNLKELGFHIDDI